MKCGRVFLLSPPSSLHCLCPQFCRAQLSPFLVRRAPRRLGSSERLDVNGDGFGDLVAHVEAADLELSASDVIAELTASRFGGRVVFGFDSIRIGR